jgi:membrane associated rhomboid family serine protease
LFPLKDNIPTDRLPIVTIALIVANVLVYFLWQRGGLSIGDPSIGGHHHYYEQLIRYAAIPHELAHPGSHCGYREAGNLIDVSRFTCGPQHYPQSQPSTWITPFTAMFMHGGLLHLGGNMLFLWIFGNNVEDSMGRLRFIAFYLLGGIAAFALQTAVDLNSSIPTLGASGAIAAVLGGYALLYPRARVLTVIFIVLFFTIVEIPALLVLGAWFLLQLVDATNAQPGGGGVAYFAHIGGFAFGLLLVRAFARRRKSAPPRLPVW